MKTLRPDLGAVAVGGAERDAFLHAQFCADLRRLAPGTVLRTAWCSPKGRVLFLPRVLVGDDTLFLVLPRAQCAALARRLGLYRLRAAASIEDLADTHIVLECRRPAPALTVVPATAAATALEALPGAAATLDEVRLAALHDGDVELDAALADAFLPQELDLDRHGGLSFDKGCYPGQEIVARVHYRGAVKRRPRRLRLTAAPPSAAARVLDEAGTPVGTVLVAVPAAGGSELLAVIDEGATPHHLEGSDSALLTG